MKKVFYILFFFSFTLLLYAEVEFPKITQRVTDQTGTLTQNEIDNISRLLQTFEDSTSNQLVVLMLSSINGYPIEEYAFKTAEQNKIGTKDKDNGILFLIVKDDRLVRIEVGYGLEGALPDITAGSIIRNEVIPHFKDNEYSAGVSAGVNAIIKATAGEYKANPKDKDKKKLPFSVSTIIFIVLLLISLFSRRKRRSGIFYAGGLGGFGGGGFGGGGSGGGGFGGFSGGGGSFGGGGAGGSW